MELLMLNNHVANVNVVGSKPTSWFQMPGVNRC